MIWNIDQFCLIENNPGTAIGASKDRDKLLKISPMLATKLKSGFWNERRVFIALVTCCAVATAVVLACLHVPAYLAYWSYEPKEGDILFQSLPRSPLVSAIEGVSQSEFSHCGIVAQEDGEWVVYEAYRRVETTPLRSFLFRGRRRAFAVYRLKQVHQQHIDATLANTRRYLGRPYDSRYQMDDESIYCSELLYKAFHEASGQSLGSLMRLGDLNWSPYQVTIRKYEQGPVPLDRLMITPKELSQANQLELVTSFRIAMP